MFTKRILSLVFLGMALIVLAACRPLFSTPDSAATLYPQYTAAAQTLEALMTQVAMTTMPTQPVASPTPQPIDTPSPTSALPTLTPTPLRTATPVTRCDWAAFVKDVSIPDGMAVGRGAAFTKIWRLKNIGTCTWTTAYSLVFSRGVSMSGPASVNLPGSVAAGQTVDISVNLTAPTVDGRYRGYWKLRNASGVVFGVGAQADKAFWVDINVTGPTFAAYDFVANYCAAKWRNNTITLPCPGSEGDSRGFVIKLNAPRLEDGSVDDEPALLTYPKFASDGFIQGKYPAFQVQVGDRFKAIVNCRYGSSSCDVIFRLDYQVGDGPIQTFAQWHEVYEGLFYKVDVDLSSLAGRSIRFILTVLANGSAKQDNALWLAPRIVRQGAATSTPIATPTPSPTPTATASPTSTPTPPVRETLVPSSTPTPTPPVATLIPMP